MYIIIKTGKTTTTERILFLSGATGHVGDVDAGDTVMDFLPQERERGITIQVTRIIQTRTMTNPSWFFSYTLPIFYHLYTVQTSLQPRH